MREPLVEHFMNALPYFNQRSLTLLDLEQFCRVKDIELLYRPMRFLHGMACEVDGCKVLRVNSLLPLSLKIISGFHELKHFEFDNMDVCFSDGKLLNLSKIEYQAQKIGAIALMPDYQVLGKSIEDLMHEYEISRQIATFRLSLH